MSFREFKRSSAKLLLIGVLVMAGCMLGAPGYSQGKYSVSGVVLDSASHKPIPFASVYLASTMVGDRADEQGKFLLTGILPGKYELMATSVGYELSANSILISSDIVGVELISKQKTTMLQEVTVKFNRKRMAAERRKNMGEFINYFIGGTQNANKCVIKNADDIVFTYDDVNRIMKVTCPTPIEIENHALGYRVFFDLRTFEINRQLNRLLFAGYPRFEELDSTEGKNDFALRKARDRAYYGSVNHFMKSLREEDVARNNFSLYIFGKMKGYHLAKYGYYPLDPRQLAYIRPDSMLNLKIVFNGEVQERNFDPESFKYGLKQTSYIKYLAPHPLVIHENGYYDDPFDFFIDGYMGWTARVIAELLPLEYQPVLTIKQHKLIQKLQVRDSLAKTNRRNLENDQE